MNRLVLQGYLNTVKYLPNSCLVYIDEHKGGYKKQSGELVPEKYMQWKIAFKGYFKKYISEHFRNGQLVEVVAEMFPFAVVDGAQVEGYSCIGKSIDVSSYPRYSAKQENKMMRDSQEASDYVPDVDSFLQPDF
jgi:hypothetical protein